MKLCIVCSKCYFQEEYTYSENTYGDNSISCHLNKLGYKANFSSQEDFYKWNSFAEECAHFEEAK